MRTEASCSSPSPTSPAVPFSLTTRPRTPSGRPSIPSDSSIPSSPRVNRNGTLIAMIQNGGVTVMDQNLNVITNLPNLDGGVVFDPLKDILYAASPSTGQI